MKKSYLLISILFVMAACDGLEPARGIASGTEITVTAEPDEEQEETKSIFSKECLGKISNVNVFVFNAESGLRALDIKGAAVGAYFDTPKIKLHFMTGKKYNIYLIANVGRIEHPLTESEMENLRFKIDNYNSFELYGFPRASSYKNFSVEDNTKVSLSVKKLVGAIDVRISDEAKWVEYEIKDICLKQAALAVRPFAHILDDSSIPSDIYASRALSAMDDVSAASESVLSTDHLSAKDIEDINNGKSVRLYFLENMMGVPEKLRENRDPHEKVSKNLSRDFATRATYIEVSVSAKTVTASYEQNRYRIYLGKNSYNDFSIQRASVCKCEIILSANKMEEEEWMMEAPTPTRDIHCKFYRGNPDNLVETEEFAVTNGLYSTITVVTNVPVSFTSYLKRLNNLYDSMTLSSGSEVRISKEEGVTIGDFKWNYNGTNVTWKHHIFYRGKLLDSSLLFWRRSGSAEGLKNEENLWKHFEIKGIKSSEAYYAFSYKITTDTPMEPSSEIMDFDEGAQQFSSVSISSSDALISKRFNVGIFTKVIPFYLEYVDSGDYFRTVTPSCVLPDIYGKVEWGGYMYFMEEQYEWLPEDSFYYTTEDFVKEEFNYFSSYPASHLENLRCTADKPKSGTSPGFKNKIMELAIKAITPKGGIGVPLLDSWIKVHCYNLDFNLKLYNDGRILTDAQIKEHLRYDPDAVFGNNANDAVYVQALDGEGTIGSYPWKARKRNKSSFRNSNYATRFVIVKQCRGSHLKLPGAVNPADAWSCYPSGTGAHYAYSYGTPSGERKVDYYSYADRGVDKMFCPYSEYKTKYRFYGHVDILKDGLPGGGHINLYGTLFSPVKFKININDSLHSSDSASTAFTDTDRQIITKLSGIDSYMRPY